MGSIHEANVKGDKNIVREADTGRGHSGML